MKVLLDTHVFLWWNLDDPRLSRTAHRLISDGSNKIYLSSASAWEIAIKASIGRLTLPEKSEKYVPSRMALHRIQPLPIQVSHALGTESLEKIHNDPFDRLLVAQCQLENLPLLTADPKITQYNIEIIW